MRVVASNASGARIIAAISARPSTLSTRQADRAVASALRGQSFSTARSPKTRPGDGGHLHVAFEHQHQRGAGFAEGEQRLTRAEVAQDALAQQGQEILFGQTPEHARLAGETQQRLFPADRRRALGGR
jgi:RNA 3'-terminal phosphate cyclase